MLNYEIILYWSDEDGVFVADVPELPVCMAHGDTQEAALANAKEAMQFWIDTATEFGDPVPEPKRRRLMYARGSRRTRRSRPTPREGAARRHDVELNRCAVGGSHAAGCCVAGVEGLAKCYMRAPVATGGSSPGREAAVSGSLHRQTGSPLRRRRP